MYWLHAAVYDVIIRQQEHYHDKIFPILESEGFTQDQLQIAWDFTTRSEDNALHTIRSLRANVDELEDDLSFTIDEVIEEDCENDRARLIKGQFSVPLFLEEWSGMKPLLRDETGTVQQNGFVDVPFSVLIGCTLIQEKSPGQLIQYGHGLFGNMGELASGYNHTLVNEYGWVMFATEWTGMKRQDAPNITLELITNPTGFVTLTERLHQGWMEFYTLSKLVRSQHFINDASFKEEDSTLIDPSTLFYYGNSQGSVLGGGYVAMHPEIERAVLGVGGMPLNLLLNRAEGFDPFLRLMETMYSDSADITLLQIIFEHFWEPVESVGWAHLQNKSILIQAGIGDKGVPTIGAQVMARAYNATLLEPYNREVYGLTSAPGPINGSAYIEWDYGIPDSAGPYPAESSEEHNPHEAVRREPLVHQQIDTFLRTGIVEQYCDGPCIGY